MSQRVIINRHSDSGYSGIRAESPGTLIAGFLVALIAWPTETAVGEVPADTIFNLGLIYGPLVMVIFIAACFVLRGYNISRADHGAAVARLAER